VGTRNPTKGSAEYMNRSDQFLLEEYKQAMEHDRYLEQSCSRIFRAYATVIVWVFILLGLLFQDLVKRIPTEGLLKVLNQVADGNKPFVVIILSSLCIFGISCIANLVVTRKVTIEYTAKLNFIRAVMMKDDDRGYFKIPTRLEERHPWSWLSEAFLFLLLISMINGLVFAMGLGILIRLSTTAFIGWAAVITVLTVGLSWLNIHRWARRRGESLYKWLRPGGQAQQCQQRSRE